jgi:hypothetical protein
LEVAVVLMFTTAPLFASAIAAKSGSVCTAAATCGAAAITGGKCETAAPRPMKAAVSAAKENTFALMEFGPFCDLGYRTDPKNPARVSETARPFCNEMSYSAVNRHTRRG